MGKVSELYSSENNKGFELRNEKEAFLKLDVKFFPKLTNAK